MSEAKFADVVDAVDQLDLGEQEELLQLIQRRLVEAKRDVLLKEVQAARSEHHRNECGPESVEALMREITA
jgi:hypothetical protein